MRNLHQVRILHKILNEHIGNNYEIDNTFSEKKTHSFTRKKFHKSAMLYFICHFLLFKICITSKIRIPAIFSEELLSIGITTVKNGLFV